MLKRLSEQAYQKGVHYLEGAPLPNKDRKEAKNK